MSEPNEQENTIWSCFKYINWIPIKYKYFVI